MKIRPPEESVVFGETEDRFAFDWNEDVSEVATGYGDYEEDDDEGDHDGDEVQAHA